MLPSLTKFYIPTQLMVALSWLAFFVPPEVISGRMVLLVILLLMLTNVGKEVTIQARNIPLFLYDILTSVSSKLQEKHLYRLLLHIAIRYIFLHPLQVLTVNWKIHNIQNHINIFGGTKIFLQEIIK